MTGENRRDGHREPVVIVVATHKRYPMPEDPMYLPLRVGAAIGDDLGLARDDAGENISELNPYFCELTGLYWAWKHVDADYVGLAHYRRHFSNGRRGGDAWARVLRRRDIEGDLGRIRAFVPARRRYYIETLYSHYAHTHYAEHLDRAREIVADRWPEYLAAFDRVAGRRWGWMFNMMILERALLDDYCAWLFDILFELRNRGGRRAEEALDAYQARFYGRVGEILFNVWLARQLEAGRLGRDALRELPMVCVEKVDWRRKGLAFLRAKLGGRKYSGSF